MEHLLGLVFLSFICLFTLVISLQLPMIRAPIIAAFIIRTSAALYHRYIHALPDGSSDVLVFESKAFEIYSSGLIGTGFIEVSSDFYSYFLAMVYLVFGHSPLLAQGFSVFVGVLSVQFVWLLARELWGSIQAMKACWIAALFPTLVLYSALPLREAYVVLFLTAGFWSIAKWRNSDNFSYFILSLTSFSVGVLFHGGLIVAPVMLILYNAALALNKSAKSIVTFRNMFSTSIVCLFATAVVAILYAILQSIEISKIGQPTQMLDIDLWFEVMQERNIGAAAFPSWLLPGSGFDLIWIVPLRVVYFLFGPFLWDARSILQVIGSIDGLIYLALAVRIWRNRKLIQNNRAALAVSLILLPLLVAYSIGVGNFGTGLRHRSKFVALLLVLAAPKIKGFAQSSIKEPDGRISNSSAAS